jgi:hypothetical protein
VLVKSSFLKQLTQAKQVSSKILRKDFILCKTRILLNEFMAPITEKADKPRQKFLRQAVGAILLYNWGRLSIYVFRTFQTVVLKALKILYGLHRQRIHPVFYYHAG